MKYVCQVRARERETCDIVTPAEAMDAMALPLKFVA
jgi:hypothetical protein